jgi:hypothetical protein
VEKSDVTALWIVGTITFSAIFAGMAGGVFVCFAVLFGLGSLSLALAEVCQVLNEIKKKM